MDCLTVTGALGVLIRTDSEVEAQLGQVGNVTGFWVGDIGCRVHDEVYNDKGGGLLSLDRRVLNVVGFNLTGEASVQSGVGLFVGRISWVGEAI